MDDATADRTRTGPRAPEPSDRPDQVDEHASADGRQPEPRYRPGRGGYDPEAAALAAQAKYAFRQRMVLVLVVFAVISAVLAATVGSTDLWCLHGALDLGLIGYLAYLRRQVRMEQAIRARRAARGAGSRRGPSVDNEVEGQPQPERAGRPARSRRRPGTVADAVAARQAARLAESTDTDPHATADDPDDSADDSDRPHETGTQDDAEDDTGPQQPTLPRLQPTPLPLPPPGATRLELDDEDPELHDLQSRQPRGYRRAAGQ